jgi:ribonuclease J
MEAKKENRGDIKLEQVKVKPYLVSKKYPSKPRKLEAGPKALKFFPMGGVEQWGKHMWIVEQEGDILIMDMGFQFPGNSQPGVDYIIPNLSYLKDNEKKIKGLFLTSPHYDHIGAVPYFLHFFPDIKIFASREIFTILESRRDFFTEKMTFKKYVLKHGEGVKVGSLKVEPFYVSGNAPGMLGLCIYTYQGQILYLPNFKLDYHPVNQPPMDLGRLAELSGEEGIFAVLMDSIGAELHGYSPSEIDIEKELEHMIATTTGKCIISIFPSMIGRIQQIVRAAEANKRNIYIEGRSLLNTFNNARKARMLDVKRGTVVGPDKLETLPDEKLLLLCTGGQGDDLPHFMRIANREHPTFVINEGDKVIFSSSAIPGNERSIQKLKDNLIKQGALIEQYQYLDVFYRGHAQREELKIIYNILKPKFFIPTHGPHYLLAANANLANILGHDENRVIVPKTGQAIVFDKKQLIMTKESIPSFDIMVDGLGVGDLKDVVIRDRQMMASDGIFNVILVIDGQSHKILQGPEIISKGFVYMKDSEGLLEEVKKSVRALVESKMQQQGYDLDASYLRDELREQLSKFLFMKTERRPMVLPIIVIT